MRTIYGYCKVLVGKNVCDMIGEIVLAMQNQCTAATAALLSFLRRR